jgi:hypothetical protein
LNPRPSGPEPGVLSAELAALARRYLPPTNNRCEHTRRINRSRARSIPDASATVATTYLADRKGEARVPRPPGAAPTARTVSEASRERCSRFLRRPYLSELQRAKISGTGTVSGPRAFEDDAVAVSPTPESGPRAFDDDAVAVHVAAGCGPRDSEDTALAVDPNPASGPRVSRSRRLRSLPFRGGKRSNDQSSRYAIASSSLTWGNDR